MDNSLMLFPSLAEAMALVERTDGKISKLEVVIMLIVVFSFWTIKDREHILTK